VVSVFRIDFGGMEWQGRRDGVRDKTYSEGKPGAESQHRAVSIVPGTRLLMVEDA
jgi:hypothetical protein